MLSLAVLGTPISHSRSPRIHQAALDHLGLAGTYEALDVDEPGMRTAAGWLRTGRLSGANITMPHKELAYTLCDHVEGPANRARSVNTWVGVGGHIVGHSTDIPGVVATWTRRGLGDGPVLILGSGGAAAAALVALEGRHLLVSARRPEAGRRLIELTGSSARMTPWGQGHRAVVVNATPIGMRGEPLPSRVLAMASGLFEMAYGPQPTPATLECLQRHLPHADGIDLLVNQAALSFELWTGVAPPLDVMEHAARK